MLLHLWRWWHHVWIIAALVREHGHEVRRNLRMRLLLLRCVHICSIHRGRLSVLLVRLCCCRGRISRILHRCRRVLHVSLILLGAFRGHKSDGSNDGGWRIRSSYSCWHERLEICRLRRVHLIMLLLSVAIFGGRFHIIGGHLATTGGSMRGRRLPHTTNSLILREWLRLRLLALLLLLLLVVRHLRCILGVVWRSHRDRLHHWLRHHVRWVPAPLLGRLQMHVWRCRRHHGRLVIRCVGKKVVHSVFLSVILGTAARADLNIQFEAYIIIREKIANSSKQQKRSFFVFYVTSNVS